MTEETVSATTTISASAETVFAQCLPTHRGMPPLAPAGFATPSMANG